MSFYQKCRIDIFRCNLRFFFCTKYATAMPVLGNPILITNHVSLTKGVPMKKCIIAVLAVAAFAACGGGGSGGGTVTGDIKTLSVVSSTTTGDFTPSVTVVRSTSGTLQFSVAGIDVDGDGTIDSPTLTGCRASGGAAAMTAKALADTQITCDGGSPVEGGSTSFDIALSLDTTSSMGGAAGVLADKIVTFANALSAAGVDAQFAGITVGDAFATKAGEGVTAYSDTDFSKGSLGTPTDTPFDTYERPDTGTALLSAADIGTFFTAVKNVIGSGGGGAGGVENYLGSVQRLYSATAWRSGANRMIISIGDNCAYTPVTMGEDGITGVWAPPEGTDLAAALAGNAIVHVAGTEGQSCSASNYYDPKDLAAATGGIFLPIPFGSCSSADTCDVDLITDFHILDSITGGTIYLCDGLSTTYGGSGTYTFVLTVEVAGRTATVTMVITLGF